MKTHTVEIPDDIYEGVARRAALHGTTVDQQVVELLKRFASEQDTAKLENARKRMAELFRTVEGFRLTKSIPREELYERGRIS